MAASATHSVVVPLDGLLVEGSPFRLVPLPTPSDMSMALTQSLRELGQLVPVVAYHCHDGNFQLVDGFRRARSAATLGWPHLRAEVLPAATPPETLLAALVAVRETLLRKSPVARSRCVRLGLDMGVGEQWLCERLLPAVGQESHAQVLRKHMVVSELSPDALAFCEAKGFSLKQCVRLRHYPPALVAAVLSWREQINLTASTLFELLADAHDYLRAHDLEPRAVNELPAVCDTLFADGSPHERTSRLRAAMRGLRLPTLTAVNERMDAVAAQMDLPEGARVRWDRSLEEKRLTVEVMLHCADDYLSLWSQLARAPVVEGLRALLGEL